MSLFKTQNPVSDQFYNSRNGAANHRANDVLVREGMPQVLSARFSYGPLDMAALSGMHKL